MENSSVNEFRRRHRQLRNAGRHRLHPLRQYGRPSGGGVYVALDQSATFTNTTIDGNAATTDDGGGIIAGQDAHPHHPRQHHHREPCRSHTAAASFCSRAPTLRWTNSVIALNTAGTSGADVAETGTPSTLTAGHSFFGTTVSPGIDTDNGGNINGGGDPLLGALADNGGAVADPDRRSAASPLINAGSTDLPRFPST